MTGAGTAGDGIVLLTGSEGAIGSHLGPALQAAGYSLRSLDLRPASTGGRDHHVVDLLDLEAVHAAMHGVAAVVHAGAIPWDRGDGSRVISTNVLGTWRSFTSALSEGMVMTELFVRMSVGRSMISISSSSSSSVSGGGTAGKSAAPRRLAPEPVFFMRTTRVPMGSKSIPTSSVGL